MLVANANVDAEAQQGDRNRKKQEPETLHPASAATTTVSRVPSAGF